MTTTVTPLRVPRPEHRVEERGADGIARVHPVGEFGEHVDSPLRRAHFVSCPNAARHRRRRRRP